MDDRVIGDKDEKGLHRWIDGGDDIRVELTLKNAIDAYNVMNPDIAEVYSQPRINDEASAEQY